ncbi:MAG: primase, primase protein [Candidatus Parcubacteria bacterium]|jgi:DNA primase
MQNNHQIQEIKERLPIEEVVSRYIKLEKSGINLKGLCPFHGEKTPSFFVAPHRGSFMCFGCGKKGDIFTFVQEIEGIEFFDALKQLAEQAGVTLELQKTDSKEKKDSYAILEKACLVFQSHLQKDIRAQEYLSGRGLSEQTIRQFRIGFIPDEWNLLYTELKNSFDEKEILESGLVIKHENGRVYDRFRGRIMFPIFDSNGKVIAFTGRVLIPEQKDTPKYVNSPETSLFSKSHVLYGLNFAKQSIRKHNFVILVEGQMDVIMSHQMGYSNTVASSGTAFTQDQLQIISKLTPNLLLAFDSDSAGLTTTAKVWEMAINQGLDVKIAYYEGAKDPADTIKDNPELWKNIIKGSIHIIEFVSRLIAKISDERKRIKAYQERILPLLRRVHTYSEKNFFIEKISTLLSINSAIIWSDLSLGSSEIESKNIRQYERVEKIEQEPIVSSYISFFSKINPEIKNTIEEFLKTYNLSSINLENIDEKKLFQIEELYEKEEKLVRNEFKEVFSQYVLSLLKNKNKELKMKLHSSDQDVSSILKQIEDYKKLIHTIGEKDCQFINNMV